MHWSFCPSVYIFFLLKTKRIDFYSRGIKTSLSVCVFHCSPYFSAMSTQKILDELRPQMCPIESSFVDTMKMFELFLPIYLPPDLHNQGFKFAHFLFSYFFLLHASLQIMVT
jgi:hypothetical protein